MTEKTLERRLRESVKRKGGLAVKIWAVSFTGLPDRLVLMPGGYAYFAEIKTPGRKPQPRQTAVHEILKGLGFAVTVIDSDTALDSFLKLVGNGGVNLG